MSTVTTEAPAAAPSARRPVAHDLLLNALPHPILVLAADNGIVYANPAAELFVSADQEWMDYLDQRGLIDKATRRNIVSNRLVLIAPVDSPLQLKIAPGFAIAAALGKGRLATGDPDSVPVGRYARQALTTLGVWNDVADRLVRAEDVRHALMFVARGEVPLGIVYETDARMDPRVRVIDTFPNGTHLPIT